MLEELNQYEAADYLRVSGMALEVILEHEGLPYREVPWPLGTLRLIPLDALKSYKERRHARRAALGRMAREAQESGLLDRE